RENCCSTNQPLGCAAVLSTEWPLPSDRYLALATERRVTVPWPQSNTSNCWALPAVAPLAVSVAPAPVAPVRYLPVALSCSAIRSAPSLELTVPLPPSRCVTPCNGVTA